MGKTRKKVVTDPIEETFKNARENPERDIAIAMFLGAATSNGENPGREIEHIIKTFIEDPTTTHP